MKAITTKYHGPGNVKSSHIIADDGDGNRLTVGVDNSLRLEDCHANAALALCRKLKWEGRLQGGHIKAGMVWVWIDERNQVLAE
jgi:hypothetical protein